MSHAVRGGPEATKSLQMTNPTQLLCGRRHDGREFPCRSKCEKEPSAPKRAEIKLHRSGMQVEIEKVHSVTRRCTRLSLNYPPCL